MYTTRVALSTAVFLVTTTLSAQTLHVDRVTPLSGPTGGGTILTITGSGFHDDRCRVTCATDAILIDGVPATNVRFPSPGVITVVTPPHTPAEVEIEIITPSNEHIHLSQRFTYVDSTRLVLRGGRFQVRLSAVNPRDGNVTAGEPVPFNDKFGFFVLPGFTNDRENPEVFVKIVGPLSDTGGYLFFYGGLTDVEYTVTVTDTSSHSVRSYVKPSGEYRGDTLQP
jgi:hypothetical protein